MTHFYERKPTIIEAGLFRGGDESAAKVLAWIIQNGGDARHILKGEWNSQLRIPYGNKEEYYWDDGVQSDPGGYYVRSDAPEFIAVRTKDAWGRVNPGDYIIKGTEGEFYPCAGDIFPTLYDRVEGEYDEQGHKIMTPGVDF